MSVWFCIPSARPAEEANRVLELWHERGYKIALYFDSCPPMGTVCRGERVDGCAVIRDFRQLPYDHYAHGYGSYPGYAKAVNNLISNVMKLDPDAEWFVTGGDDTEPDPNHTAEEIANQCSEHFERETESSRPGDRAWGHATFGVMQPTGDRFAGGSIDRIAGSPWIGREFALRVNGGQGPYWPEYTHMFVDEEIMQVALKLGVFWQRPDLVHLHHHFMRKSTALDSVAVSKPIPAHLVEANSQAHWNRYQSLFLKRKAQGFPGHEPVSVEVCA